MGVRVPLKETTTDHSQPLLLRENMAPTGQLWLFFFFKEKGRTTTSFFYMLATNLIYKHCYGPALYKLNQISVGLTWLLGNSERVKEEMAQGHTGRSSDAVLPSSSA